jgi:hypothetical protein
MVVAVVVVVVVIFVFVVTDNKLMNVNPHLVYYVAHFKQRTRKTKYNSFYPSSRTYSACPYAVTIKYSKPSLIRLQLIRISDNPDRNMKNEKKNAVHSGVHILKDTWDL